MRAVDPDKTWDFIFPEEAEAKPEEQTIFHLATLDVLQEAFLEDRLGTMSDEGYSVKLGTQDLIAFHIGLVGVDNLLDKDDKPIKFVRDMAAKPIFNQGDRKIYPWKAECLSAIPKDKRKVLAKAIKDGPKLKEAEVKN